MAKNKNSIVKKKNKYRTIEWSCFIGEFVSAATPFVTIAIVNYDKYFVEYDGVKMSISFFMALAVMGMAIFLIAKKKFENSYVTLLLGWAVVAFIFTMIGELIVDLANIMWFGLIGLLGSYGLEISSKKARQKKKEIMDIINQAEKENAVEKYKEEQAEINEKKVKIKVKK